MEFKPAREKDGGTYFCRARNKVGTSDELSVTFDVLYPPRKVMTEPQRLVNLDVSQSAEFQCEAEANPPAKFEWLQRLSLVDDDLVQGQKGQVYSRGFGKDLKIQNVTYEHEGQWACVASTLNKGRQRQVTSDPIAVEVVGRPQILAYKTDKKQVNKQLTLF